MSLRHPEYVCVYRNAYIYIFIDSEYACIEIQSYVHQCVYVYTNRIFIG